jgi:histidinol-phosphatase (PHP family)
VNTRIPLHSSVLRWWRDEGGQEITFGSDAHDPMSIAAGFADASAMAEAHGFRAGPTPFDPWVRA